MIGSIRMFLAFGTTICLLSALVIVVTPNGTADQQIGWVSLTFGLLLVLLSVSTALFLARRERTIEQEDDWLN